MSSVPFPIGGFTAVLGSGPYATTIRGFNFSNPFGTTWFIDGTNGSNGNDGKSAATAFATAAYALSVSAAGDTFVFAPGTYTISASFVPLANQTFLASVIQPRKPKVIFLSSAIADLIQVDVSGCTFIGIEFQAGDNTCDNLIDVADGAAVAGLNILNCAFNGADKTTVVGINCIDATFAGSFLNVQGCLFHDLTGTCIAVGVLGFGYSYIGFNQFAIDVNSGVGIALADTTTFAIGKGYVIERNLFTGFDATGDEVGITIAGTENTTGAGIINDNRFAYIAVAAITIDKLGFSEVENYVGDSGTGGTRVDPGT